MMLCTAQVRGLAAVSVGSVLSLTLSYPAVWNLETRAAIFVLTVAFSLAHTQTLSLNGANSFG